MSYDAWKCTDPALEKAGRAEEALDRYELDVVEALVGLGVEFPTEDHREELFDWMNDEVHPQDAAVMLTEE